MDRYLDNFAAYATTTTSWWERMNQSRQNIIVTLLLFVGGIGLLIGNEGHYVHLYHGLQEEGIAHTVPLPDVNHGIDPVNDGKLPVVHMIGMRQTKEMDRYNENVLAYATTTTTTSWWARMKQSFQDIIMGLVLFVGGIVVLIWNEGNYVDVYDGLKEGIANTVHLPDVNRGIDPANDGKLLHMIGMVQSNVIMNDDEFGIHLYTNTNYDNNKLAPIKLHRIVKMYQWIEQQHTKTEKNLGGSTTTTTTYTYTKDWDETIQNSQSYHDPYDHQNPTSMPFTSKEIISTNVTMGSYVMTGNSTIMNRINWYEPLDRNDFSIHDIPTGTLRDHIQPLEDGYYYPVNRDGLPSSPQIGDIRISYQVVPSQIISVIGCQNYNTITPYVTKIGTSILLIENGKHDIHEMFNHTQQELKRRTWVCRGIGFILLWISLMTVAYPIVVLADVIPFWGYMVDSTIAIVALILSMILSTCIIALAWLYYRSIHRVLRTNYDQAPSYEYIPDTTTGSSLATDEEAIMEAEYDIPPPATTPSYQGEYIPIVTATTFPTAPYADYKMS